MSGTLAAPSDNDDELRYQVPIFGLPSEGTVTRKYASPFPLRNQRWIYCPDTLGTYRERGAHVRRYVEHITGVGQATPGVTAVFFSSYGFLEQVRAGIPASEQALIVAESRADAQGRISPPISAHTRLACAGWWPITAGHISLGCTRGNWQKGRTFRGICSEASCACPSRWSIQLCSISGWRHSTPIASLMLPRHWEMMPEPRRGGRRRSTVAVAGASGLRTRHSQQG